MIALLVSPIAAQSWSSEIGQLRARLRALQGSAWSLAAEQDLVDDVADLATRFRSRGGSASAAPELRRLVEDVHDRHAGWLKAEQAAVIARDGDLEALQESAAWRQHERLALQSQYALNWVQLEAAIRYETRHRQREEWLREAAEGFSTVATSAEEPSLIAESLYGRGLCRRALQEWKAAIDDFRRALEAAPNDALNVSIHTALIETLIEADRIGEALEASRSLSARTRSAEADFLRAKVLLLSLADPETPRSRRSAHRREAVDAIARLEGRGGKWAQLGRQLAAAGIRHPQEWLGVGANATIQWIIAESLRDRGECEKAIPVYEALAKEKSSGPEVLLALGACQLATQRYEAAFDTLTATRAAEGSNDEVRADAAYLRFKAAEAIHQGEDTQQTSARLAEAASDYATSYSDHPHVFEAHFRLGELERSAGRCAKAVAHYDAVPSESPLYVQALYESARCDVAEWERRNAVGEGAGGADLIAAALQKFEKLFQEVDRRREAGTTRAADVVVLSAIEAHARVLGALTLTRSNEENALEEAVGWLDRFSAIEPTDEDLQAQATLVRGVVLLKRERYGEAQIAIADFLRSYDPSRRNVTLLRRLAAEVLELAARQRQESSPVGARELDTLALDIYTELLRLVDAGVITDQSSEGLRRLIADLKRET